MKIVWGKKPTDHHGYQFGNGRDGAPTTSDVTDQGHNHDMQAAARRVVRSTRHHPSRFACQVTFTDGPA